MLLIIITGQYRIEKYLFNNGLVLLINYLFIKNKTKNRKEKKNETITIILNKTK